MSRQQPTNGAYGLGFSSVVTKTANYTIAAADLATVFKFNGSSLTAKLPATAPSMVWGVAIVNVNSTALTVDPNGLTLNGSSSTFTIPQGGGIVVWSDGTNYVSAEGIPTSTASIQNSSFTYAADTGSANAYAVALSPAVTSYVAGLLLYFNASNTNTTSSTLAVNGLAAKTIKKLNGTTNLVAGDITAGQVVAVIYDGTNFQLVSEMGTAESTSHKDAANGYAGLDANTLLKVAEQQTAVHAIAASSYAILDSDRAKTVTFSDVSPAADIPVTIAQAGASSQFIAGWYAYFQNLLAANVVTITPTTSTINSGTGAKTSLKLGPGQSVMIVSDGTNYLALFLSLPGNATDAQILTWVASDARWEPKGISTLGGANASSLRGNNISSSSPQNQDVLKWITADNQWDIVLADGMEHGDAVWPVDSAWVGLRDEFIHYSAGATQLTGTQTTDIGELGWILLGTTGTSNNAPRFQGGVAPNIGTVSWTNNATAINFGALLLNDYDGNATIHQNAYALFENAGWKMTWVFKFDNEMSQSTAQVRNLFQKKSMYIGLTGAAISAISAVTQITARPDIFFGVRFDTSTTPQGFTISSVAAGTGVYTAPVSPGILGGGSNAYAGMNVTFTGFANAANNGTFSITASSTTTLTTSNSSSVLETVSPTGSAYAVVASIPSTGTAGAASGGNTVYNIAAGIIVNANQYQGLSFVVTGGVASGGANNGTFTCVASTTTTITLNNGAGVAETHALFLTGGNLGDTALVLEAVQNQTFATGSGTTVRHNLQGTTVAGPAPNNNWHRLDISSTTAGQIVIQLDGSNTYKLTYSVASMTYATNGNGLIETTGQQLSFSNTVGYTNARNCGVMPFSAGSSVTIAGLTGGPSAINGTYIVEAVIAGSPPVLILPSTQASGQTIQQSTQTIAGLPAVTPCAIFGNDDTQVPYVTTRFFVDFFALVWNKGIASPSTIPSASNPRYW